MVEWIAVALSRNTNMGSSSAMECVRGTGSNVTEFASFTVGTTAAPRDLVRDRDSAT